MHAPSSPSLQMSDLASLASSAKHDGDAALARGGKGEKEEGRSGMTPHQQAAMNQFLAAQRGGDPLAKEERWRELVRAMKAGEDRRATPRRRRREPRSRSRSSARSLSSRDEILGTLKIVTHAQGDGSIASGLTSMEASARSALSSLSNSNSNQHFFDNSNSKFDENGGNKGSDNGSDSEKWAVDWGDVEHDAREGKRGSNERAFAPTASPARSPLSSPAREEKVPKYAGLSGRPSPRIPRAAPRSVKLSPRALPARPGGRPGPRLSPARVPEGLPPPLPLTRAVAGLHPRTDTPPNVLASTAGGDKQDFPLVSPLSLGSFDGDYLVDASAAAAGVGNFPSASGDTAIASNVDALSMPTIDGGTDRSSHQRSGDGGDEEGDDREANAVFFDIGTSFADNSRRAALARVPLKDWGKVTSREQGCDDETQGGDGIGVESGPGITHDETRASESGERAAAAAGSPPRPLSQGNRQRRRPPQPNRLVSECNNELAPGWPELIGQSIDGEFVSFQETLPLTSSPPSPQRSLVERNQQHQTQQQPQKEQNASLTNQSMFTDNVSVRPVVSSNLGFRSKPKSMRRRLNHGNKTGVGNTNKNSLEDQILSVVLQQKDSEDKEGFTVHSNTKNSGCGEHNKECSDKESSSSIRGTAATASAQDILRELRSSTPCTLNSGGTSGGRRSSNSGCDNSSARNSSIQTSHGNQPPCGSIDIGQQRPESQERPPHQLQRKSPQRLVAASPAPSDRRARRQSPLPCLAPSRRDRQRPGYVKQQNALEPSTATKEIEAASLAGALCSEATCGDNTFATKSKAAVEIPHSPMKLSHVLAKDDIVRTTQKKNNEASNVSTIFFHSEGTEMKRTAGLKVSEAEGADTVAPLSPLQRYCKNVGISNHKNTGVSKVQVKSSELRRRTFGNKLFPHTSPAVGGTERVGDNKRLAAQQKSSSSTNLSNQNIDLTRNPFNDSPPRRLCTDNPFDSQLKTEENLYQEQSSRVPIDDTPVEEQQSHSSEELIRHCNGRQRRPPAAKVPLAPSKRDTALPKKATSTAAPGPTASSLKARNLDKIRASITELKYNGVGGVGKSTSTLVRDEETGRYIIRDIDDKRFHEIINCEAKVASKAMHEKEDEKDGSSNNEDNVVPPMAIVTPTAKNSPDKVHENLSLWQRGWRLRRQHKETQEKTPIKSMMTNQIMNESVLDDEVVDDAVRAATDILSVTSSATTCATNETAVTPERTNVTNLATTNNKSTAKEASGRQQRVASKENGAGLPPVSASLNGDSGENGFFVVQRPSTDGYFSHGQRLWSSFHDDAKWSAFEDPSPTSLSQMDFFEICPSKPMDDWGFTTTIGTDDDESFAPSPQWDDDDSFDNDLCRNNNEEVGANKEVFPTSLSVCAATVPLSIAT